MTAVYLSLLIYGLAAIVNLAALIMAIRAQPSAPYHAMWLVQVMSTALNLVVSIVLGWTMLAWIDSVPAHRDNQFAMHVLVLIAASLLLNSTISLARALYERFVRQAEVDATRKFVSTVVQANNVRETQC